MQNSIVVLVTTSSADEANNIAQSLVKEKLIACANIIEHIRSIFNWQGRVCDESECLLILKSVDSRFDEIRQKVKELHSYEVPEIIALPVIDGNAEYLDWLAKETSMVG